MALEDYFVEHNAARFDGFNLSNVFEYMSLTAYHAALEQIVSAARPGARLVYWNLLAPRRRSPEFAERLLSLEKLASSLHRQDHAFFYSALIIEEVIAPN
jgi:S-adenosylmethionine-diacylglycerol 3-amino-3-carboxypropyl transferase